jgi:uncharacterized protein involved in outer membrane biogenesis
LFTALIGPYLVDWTAYRDRFEREAERALGQPVTVAGKADLRILPTPVVSFTDVRVGDPDRPGIVIERFRAQVELTPLLKGEINILEMVVERPTFSLDLADLRNRGGAGRPIPVDPQRVSLNQVEIVQGEALVVDSRAGRQWSVSGINALIEARSLRGPARLDGGLIVNGEPLTLRAAAGRLEADSVPLRLTLTPANLAVTLTLDGRLALPEGEMPLYAGTFSSGALEPLEPVEGQPAAAPPVPALRASGAFELSPDRLTLSEGELAYGPQERPIHATMQGHVDLGARPRFHLALDARQIDIDRSLGGGPGDPVSIERAATLLLDSLEAIPVPAMAGTLRLDARGVVVGGSVIQALGVDLEPRADGWRIDILSALLPGDTRIDVTGDLALTEPAAFIGKARLQSRRPAAFAAWWRGAAGAAAGIDSFDIETDLSLRPGRQTAENLHLALDGGTIRGGVDVQTFEASGETFVSVELAADRLDIEKARTLAAVAGGSDLAAGVVDRMALKLSADSLLAGGIEARGVTLDGELQAERLDLRRLAVADLAGARIEARGRVSDPLGEARGRLDATLAADDLSGAASFLTGLLPGNAAVGRFARVAPALAPVDATLAFSGGTGDDSLTLELNGTFGGTQASLSAAGAGSLMRPETLAGRLDGLLVGDDTAVLLSQLGFDVIPLPDSGPARLELAVEGAVSGGAAVGLEAEAAGTRLHVTGQAELTDAGLVGAGDLELESGDVDPLLLLAGVALPGLGEGHAVTARGPLTVEAGRLSLSLAEASFDETPVRGELTLRTGEPLRAEGRLEVKRLSLPLLFGAAGGQLPERPDGAWPDDTFAVALPAWIALDLALAAEEVDLGLGPAARNGALRFSFKDGAAAIDGFEAELAGGRLTGAVQLAMRGGQAALELSAAIERASLAELAWHGGGRPLLRGLLDASFELNGRGRSLAGLVSTLSGSGSFAVSDGLVRSVNPHAFSSIIRAADSGLELERDAVEAAFRGHLDAGTLMFDRASGSFSVSSGILRVSTISVDAPSASVLGGAALDLNDMTLRSDWSLKVDPGPERVAGAEPEVGLVFAGPIAAPERAVDVTPLLGFLTVRAFEQEVERIENLQADILEKDFFLRQHRREREERAWRRRQAEEAERLAREAAEAADAEEEAPAAEDEEARAPADGSTSAAARRPLPPLEAFTIPDRPIRGNDEPLQLLQPAPQTRPGG